MNRHRAVSERTDGWTQKEREERETHFSHSSQRPRLCFSEIIRRILQLSSRSCWIVRESSGTSPGRGFCCCMGGPSWTGWFAGACFGMADRGRALCVCWLLDLCLCLPRTFAPGKFPDKCPLASEDNPSASEAALFGATLATFGEAKMLRTTPRTHLRGKTRGRSTIATIITKSMTSPTSYRNVQNGSDVRGVALGDPEAVTLTPSMVRNIATRSMPATKYKNGIGCISMLPAELYTLRG